MKHVLIHELKTKENFSWHKIIRLLRQKVWKEAVSYLHARGYILLYVFYLDYFHCKDVKSSITCESGILLLFSLSMLFKVKTWFDSYWEVVYLCNVQSACLIK